MADGWYTGGVSRSSIIPLRAARLVLARRPCPQAETEAMRAMAGSSAGHPHSIGHVMLFVGLKGDRKQLCVFARKPLFLFQFFFTKETDAQLLLLPPCAVCVCSKGTVFVV